MQAPKNFIPEPFKYHEEVELIIEDLSNLGVGIGRLKNWVIMVPFALPGELVKARIYRNFKNYSEGDLLEVLKPSKDRVKPFCEHFSLCGGCQYQNLHYPAQLQWKQKQVQDVFKRIGGITTPVQPTITSPQTSHYRSKITPHYPKPQPEKALEIGFLKQGTRHNIVPIKQCPIASKAINEALPEAFKALQKMPRGGTLLFRDSDEGVLTDNKAIASQTVKDLTFRFPAGEFFQNNPFILPKFLDIVLEYAQDEQTPNLIDAYCGVGLFALSAHKHFKNIFGVEVNKQAIDWAKKNAQAGNIDNVQFLSAKAEAIFEQCRHSGEATSLIIDPPRKGCDTAFLDQVLAFRPKRIVYVSCDPATQARDIAYLKESYSVKKVQPFDFFPHTRHIENVALLTKIEN